MKSANLSGADLSDANFNRPDLSDAILDYASLDNAKVENARFYESMGITESLKRDLIEQGGIFEPPLVVSTETNFFRTIWKLLVKN